MESLPVELMNTVRADRDGVRDTIADPAAAARWLRQARPGIGIAGWEAVAELRDLRDALRHLAAAATGDDRPAAATDHDRPAAATGDDRPAAAAATDGEGATLTTGEEVATGADGGRADQRPGERLRATSRADLEAAVGVLNRACARAPSWSELRWPPDDDGTDAAAAGGGEPVRVTRSAHDPALAAVAAIAEEAVALFAGPDRLLLRACRAPGCVLYFVRNHPRREWCSDGCGNRARVARHYQRHHGNG